MRNRAIRNGYGFSVTVLKWFSARAAPDTSCAGVRKRISQNDDWNANANTIDDNRWNDDNRVFSRNSLSFSRPRGSFLFQARTF